MSKHVSYRGVTIDMDSIRRENEKSVALGNMGVNAKGDKIVRGTVTKTADQMARENHRIPSSITMQSLKPPVEENFAEVKKPAVNLPKAKEKVVKKERELPNGDIVEE